MTLKEAFQALATKAGIQQDALQFGEGDTVADDLFNSINTALLSVNDAKNNHPEIKAVYQKQALDAIDKKIMEYLDEVGADDQLREAIKGEKSTFNRSTLLAKKVAELADAKAAAAAPADKKAIQLEIDNLNGKIRTLEAEKLAEKGSYDKALNDYKIGSKIETLLASRKTIHDELPASVKNTILNTLISSELKQKNINFTLNESGELSLTREDGTNYYNEAHEQVQPDKFIDSLLANSKQLKTAAPAAIPSIGTPTQVVATHSSNSSGLISKNARMLEDFAANS